MARKKINFETSMEELEEYVRRLEEGNLSLEEAIKVFQKGIEASKYCAQQLEEAESKIMVLTDELKEQPFILEEE